MTDKMQAIEAIQDLSERATFEEILESLATLAAIRRGQQAVRNGDVTPHAEVESRLESWITKSSGPARP